MKLQRIDFDDLVCIPLGKDNGSGVGRTDLRESSFTSADGWDIDWDPVAKECRLWREGMPEMVYVGSAYYSRVEMPPVALVQPKKGKR